MQIIFDKDEAIRSWIKGKSGIWALGLVYTDYIGGKLREMETEDIKPYLLDECNKMGILGKLKFKDYKDCNIIDLLGAKLYVTELITPVKLHQDISDGKEIQFTNHIVCEKFYNIARKK